MPEIQDIFIKYGSSLKEKSALPIQHQKAISAIESCRTATLGGHRDECDDCGHINISYNSCRNRNCPKCGTLAKEKWILSRKNDLLKTAYFHVVFTIPYELNSIVLYNQEIMLKILFDATSQTLLELSKDPKYLGATTGFLAVLHTWGQNLQYHPHVHCIVPAGGLSFDEKNWVNSNYEDFLIPVKVMSELFKKKFLNFFDSVFNESNFSLKGDCADLVNPSNYFNFKDMLYKKKWVVYAKEPFGSPDHVIKYLGRYTNRTAISNSRILSIDDGLVSFKWRDYKDKNTEKVMTLTAHQFMRRFLMHVLPTGFMKIRYYGFLANANRNKKLASCKKIFKLEEVKITKMNYVEFVKLLFNVDLTVCPCCKTGTMQRKISFQPNRSG